MAGRPAVRGRARRGPWLLVAAALAAAVAVGLWLAGQGPAPTLDQRTGEVAAGLRCPSCQGQSVAASESDLARQMRQVIREQLAQGSTPGQVRSWFATRYGDGVLLDPPLHGAGLVLALVPVAALGGGLLLVARGPRRRRLAFAAAAVAAVGVVSVVPRAVSSGAGATAPPAPSSAATAATEAAAAAPRSHPMALSGVPPQLTRRALEALRDGDPASAERLAAQALGSDDRPSPAATDALLVLGLAQRAQHEPGADHTLRAFLAAAPEHPAAARVRALLAGAG